MSTQPITQHDEQTTDPAVRERLMAACDTQAVLPPATLRARIARAGRTSDRVASQN